jgi:hypothetical protein
MLQQTAPFTASALVICIVLSGCGATGATSQFVLSLDPSQSAHVESDIRVASGAMEANASHLNVVNVRPWGKFVPDDLRNLEYSLRDTIRQTVPAPSPVFKSRLDIHLVIRRYIVSVSNTAAAVLVCVAWAATTADGKILYQEEFYASKAGYLITTTGLLKDSVHKAIVRRIATIAMALASRRSLPSRFEGTSISLEEAVSHVPRTLMSLGNPSLAAFPDKFVGLVGLFTPSGEKIVQWEIAKPSDHFDWRGYLDKLATSPKFENPVE